MANGKQKHYYQSLARNMIVSVITVSFAPMLLVIIILLHQFTVAYHEKTYAHLTELVQKHKQQIDTFLNEKLANIRFLATTRTLENLSDDEFLQRKLLFLRNDYGNVFVDLGIIDENGSQVAYAGPHGLGNVSYADAEWFKNAWKTNSYISDVFLGIRGTPHFIVTVKQKEADRWFLVRATIDFMSFNSLVQNLRIGNTGHAFIINRAGKFQQLAHHPIEPVHLLNHDAGNLLIPVVLPVFLLEISGKALDRTQGIADLVGYAGGQATHRRQTTVLFQFLAKRTNLREILEQDHLTETFAVFIGQVGGAYVHGDSTAVGHGAEQFFFHQAVGTGQGICQYRREDLSEG